VKLVGDGVHVILDWKVKGYCSKYGASPSKNYMFCRNGYDAVKLGVGATKKNPEGKQSASHGKPHKNYTAFDHCGMTIHTGSMEYSNPEYADQLSIYGCSPAATAETKGSAKDGP